MIFKFEFEYILKTQTRTQKLKKFDTQTQKLKLKYSFIFILNHPIRSLQEICKILKLKTQILKKFENSNPNLNL